MSEQETSPTFSKLLEVAPDKLSAAMVDAGEEIVQSGLQPPSLGEAIVVIGAWLGEQIRGNLDGDAREGAVVHLANTIASVALRADTRPLN
jgi:hypothetical protein